MRRRRRRLNVCRVLVLNDHPASRPSAMTASLPSTTKYMSSPLLPCSKTISPEASSTCSHLPAMPRITAGARGYSTSTPFQ